MKNNQPYYFTGVYVDKIPPPQLPKVSKSWNLRNTRKLITELLRRGIAKFKRTPSAEEKRLLSCLAEISMLKQLWVAGMVTDREYMKIDRYIRKQYGINFIPEVGTPTILNSPERR